jgi:endonuclease YncB( thermonuclease family)
MIRKILPVVFLLLPSVATAADITGVAKVREGDTVHIGNSRIRLGGIDAPSLDQLCLNEKAERWTCGISARDELIKHADGKTWICHPRQVADRRGRVVARCEVDGEDIQKWLVRNGWALAYKQFSHDYEADEAAAREDKAGMWRGAFVAPWDWRVRKKATILGAAAAKPPPEEANATLFASASGPVAPSPECNIKGNVNRAGECIYHQPTSRWYAKIKMQIAKGTRWFCSVEEAEAAGCRETRR